MRVKARPGLEKVIPFIEETLEESLKKREKIGFPNPLDVEVRINYFCYANLNTRTLASVNMLSEPPIINLKILAPYILLGYYSDFSKDKSTLKKIKKYFSSLNGIKLNSKNPFSETKEDIHFYFLSITPEERSTSDLEDIKNWLRKSNQRNRSESEIDSQAKNFLYCLNNAEFVQEKLQRIVDKSLTTILKISPFSQNLLHELDHADLTFSPMNYQFKTLESNKNDPIIKQKMKDIYWDLSIIMEARAYYSNVIAGHIHYKELLPQIKQSLDEAVIYTARKKSLNDPKIIETVNALEYAYNNYPKRIPMTTQAKNYEDFISICLNGTHMKSLKRFNPKNEVY